MKYTLAFVMLIMSSFSFNSQASTIETKAMLFEPLGALHSGIMPCAGYFNLNGMQRESKKLYRLYDVINAMPDSVLDSNGFQNGEFKMAKKIDHWNLDDMRIHCRKLLKVAETGTDQLVKWSQD